MLNQELKKVLQDQAHIFQDTYFQVSQIHQLRIMYDFEHMNHDILLNGYLKTFTNSACA